LADQRSTSVASPAGSGRGSVSVTVSSARDSFVFAAISALLTWTAALLDRQVRPRAA
jgi:hypothetical protein